MKKISTTPSVVIRIVLWLILIFGGAIYSINKDIDNIYFNSLWFHFISFILGVILMRFAFKAASAGGKELAKKGREGDLPRLETNKLVTTGVYSCTRHPMLFGLTLIPISIALILGSPTFITIIAPLEMFFIIFMVLTMEEKECKIKYKDEYIQYSKRVPLFPKTKECFKKLFF